MKSAPNNAINADEVVKFFVSLIREHMELLGDGHFEV